MNFGWPCRQPVTLLTRNKLSRRSVVYALRVSIKIHSVTVKRTIQMSFYAPTVERNYHCSTVNLEGRGKVVSTCTFDIHLTNDVTTWSQLRTILTPTVCWDAVATACRHCHEGPAEYVRLPSPSRGTEHWRHDHRTVPVFLVAVSTACRHSIAEPWTPRRCPLAPLLVILLFLIKITYCWS